MQIFHYLKDVTTLGLTRKNCIGCGYCVQVCPHQVFCMKDKKAQITKRDDCMECGACARNCPAEAVKVHAGVGCASGIINEWLREHGVGNAGGNCCS